jgi:Domain of unknown function (DUF6265)
MTAVLGEIGMRFVLIGLALLLAPCASAQTPPATPDWMSGYWLSCEHSEQVAENWFGAGSGMLLGANLTRGAHGVQFEMLRIGASSQPSATGVSYYGQPGGRPPTEFVGRELGAHRVVFENLAHDFPQRIIYWREGSSLHARVEGVVNGRLETEEWRMRRARPNSNCRR